MNKIAKIFDSRLFLLIIVAFVDVSFGHVDITFRHEKIQNNFVESKLIFSLKEGWKLAKTPEIVVIESENVKKCIFDKDITKVGMTEYQLSFKTEFEGPKIFKDGSFVTLSLDIPMCREICTIISKKITVDFYSFIQSDDGNQNSNNQNNYNIFIILMFAIIGGLLLNIMPCVLPVILMKLRSFTTTTTTITTTITTTSTNNNTSSNSSSFKSRRIALAGTICGNYISFLAFAVFIVLIKMSGEQIGWGMHFQDPNFLKIMVIALFLLVLYSFGVLSFPLFLQINSGKHQIFIENLISSVVASIIAIPCTAPFLGTAATFAIQGSVGEMITIFFLIATGFSLPYICAFFMQIPLSVSQRLSKYSVLVKNIANYGVLITLLWIMYLLFFHIGAVGILICCMIFVFSLLFFMRKRIILAFSLLALVLFIPLKIDNDCILLKNERINNNKWISYDNVEKIPEIIHSHIKESRIVIFNISADWCLTCKYNKLNLFNNKEIQKLVRERNIICIESDMTKKNDFLMKFINKHNRVGIPFTIVYGPKKKKGILLSEIPSVKELKNAIHNVSEE